MWHLYVFMAALSAGVLLKIVHPLMGKGRHRHDDVLTRSDARFVYVLICALPVLALGLYLWQGRPDLPGAPAFVTRDRAVLTARYDDHMSLLAERPAEILIEKNPYDVGALMTLGHINMRLKKPDAAIVFYGRAYDAAKATGDWRTRLIAQTLGEVMVERAIGRVQADALLVFEDILKTYPQSPIARFYVALAQYQNGDRAAALAVWQTLLTESSTDAYWKERVRKALREARQK